MNINSPIHYIIKEALEMNKAVVIDDNSSYSLINDNNAHIFYLVIYQNDVDINSLLIKGKEYQDTLCVVSEYKLDLNPIKEFDHFINVKQYTYYGNKFKIDVSYQINKVTLDDLSYLKSHYMRIGDDDSYLINAINRGMLKAVSTDGNVMGFIGEHPEHAMGMLFIDEQYRRQGIGSALEKSLINKYIDEGKVPFGHIARDNIKSLNLQASLGLEEDQGYIYWYF